MIPYKSKSIAIITCVVIMGLCAKGQGSERQENIIQSNKNSPLVEGGTEETTLSKNDIYGYEALKDVQNQDYKGAIAKYTMMLERDEHNPSIRLQRAKVYQADGVAHEAMKDAQRIIKNPEATDDQKQQSMIIIAETYDQIGDRTRALKQYNETIKQFPTHGESYEKRADFHYKYNQQEKAITDYTKAIDITENNAELARLHRSRAKAYIAIKESKKALNDYTESIVLNVKDSQWYIDIATLFNTHQMYTESLMFLETAEEQQGKSAEILSLKAITIEKMGDDEKAIETLSEKIALNPSSSSGYKERGIVYMKGKKYAEAAQDFNNAIQYDNKNYQLYTLRANAYGHLGEKEKAAKDMEVASALIMWEEENKKGRQ